MVSAMEKEKLNAYAARVSQANRSELVVIMYEAFLDSVKEGDAQMKQGDMPACRREIERARGLLTELMGSLDFQYEISFYLRRLYIYSYHELCQGMALRDSEPVCACHACDGTTSSVISRGCKAGYVGGGYEKCTADLRRTYVWQRKPERDDRRRYRKKPRI